jgi:rhodanese-related sulfurtransferase
MKKTRKHVMLSALFAAAIAALAAPALVWPTAAQAQVVQPKEGWYRALVEYDFVRANVDIPPKPGVMVIDSRPAARQYDPGHIPGAINIPDSAFDKMTDKLPADKAALLIFYCGGYECQLSHQSAFKAEKLGYNNVKVYAAGMPEWKARSGMVAVSAAHIKKLIDDKAPYVLIDARPKRVADKGLIPTAINIPDTDFDKHVDKLPADKATTIVYYCGGLECVLSDKSADKAKKLGYTSVVTYPEGYPEWEKLYGTTAAAATGTPANATAAAVGTAKLLPGKEKGSVTVASFQQVWRDAPASVLLVDVRDAKEFAAATIKGAVNIPINDLEKKVGTLPADKPVVFICGTGARSGEAYDMVKLLRAEVQAYFIDASAKYFPDGTYTMTEKM